MATHTTTKQQNCKTSFGGYEVAINGTFEARRNNVFERNQ